MVNMQILLLIIHRIALYLIYTTTILKELSYDVRKIFRSYFANTKKQIVCFIGDGGLQMNIQELQTVINYSLPIKIIVQNNFGYGNNVKLMTKLLYLLKLFLILLLIIIVNIVLREK